MAKIFDYGDAPVAKKMGYKLTKVIYGNEKNFLEVYADMDVILVRGAYIYGSNEEFEFSLMTKPSKG